MQKINYPEFADFFQSKIAPEVQFYEKYRIKALKKTKLIKRIGFVLVVLFFVLFIFLAIKNIIITPHYIFFTIFIVFYVAKIPIYAYRKKIKEIFYQKIFNLLGLKYTNRYDIKRDIKKQISQVCYKTGIYDRYDNIAIDDVILGDYNGLPFSISDVKISYETGSSKNKHTVVVLNGLFMAIKIKKPYRGETIVKTDDYMQPRKIKSKEKVKLEDIEFEKFFEVYGSDQVESRYILTPAFMSRLVDYRKQKNCDIEIVFSEKTGLDKNLFFFVHTGKDHFELPIDVSLLNQDLLYSLIKEITDILDIVDALKLDQNIGL